jgi:glycosyltransferase involved in cell wall biosynthesis
MPDISIVIPAYNEALRLPATLDHIQRHLANSAMSAEVIVVDDGSQDGTADVVRQRAAQWPQLRLVSAERNAGKGAAVEAALGWLDRSGDPGGPVVLLADADLGASARELGVLLAPVTGGEADLAVAVPAAPPTGGFGLVRAGAAALIHRASGLTVRAPLSGQRAVTRECLDACRPLASGYGVEAAMTADAARLGFRILEVDVPVVHRFTGRDAAGFLHRARQGLDILRALAPRAVGWR